MDDLSDFINWWQPQSLDENFLDLAFGADWNPGTTFDDLSNTTHLDDNASNCRIGFGSTAISMFPEDTLGRSDELKSASHHLFKRHEQTVSSAQQTVRFSPASIKILKNWLSAHSDNPYPRVEEVEAFQRQTNLNKQQIMTWFANARRRSKAGGARRSANRDAPSSPIPAARSPRPSYRAFSGDEMDPLQRWTSSPPDQEPADVNAIARAVARSLGQVYEQTESPLTRGSSPRITCKASSASSVATSDSASLSSAYSHTSGVSLRSLESRRKTEKRRRRTKRLQPKQRQRGQYQQATGRFIGVLPRISDAYQCTFCTQTFKTKHNWQRHEKSLHLSLERWECSPDGPSFKNAQFESACVYCGVIEPVNMDAHLQSHNYEACQIRTPGERTFYRKDHLRQHLRLVHQVQFEPISMECWKSEVMQVRSRCGFCCLAISTWADRVEHLAEHFKNGKTMADWEGDWGFEPQVLEMVENSIAPYLIDYERNSPCPFEAMQQTPDGPATAFELLRLETEYFCSNHMHLHHISPSNQELQYEMCCIIFASEIMSRDTVSPASSWVRDLLMSSEDITKQAKARPIRSAIKARFTDLRTHGQENIFGSCHMEDSLQEFVKSMTAQNMEITNEALQQQACEIIWSLNECSPDSSDMLANLLVSLAHGSMTWLGDFRQRAGLQGGDQGETANPTKPRSQNAPSRAWTEGWISRVNADTGILPKLSENPVGLRSSAAQRPPGFLDDSSYYRRLIRELTRHVASATSQRNPNRHVPTDLELQHQARWILYDDDDPWNQTPADNENWLRDFKDSICMPDH